jgi:hypothetical protein
MHDPRDRHYPFHASLKEFRWKNRPLVIFAPSDRNDDYAEQLQELEGAAKGLADREMVVIHALGGSGPRGTTTGGQIEFFDTSPPRRQTLRAADVDSLRDNFGVDGQQFVVLLIGKDGGAKLQAEEPVTTTELFSLVDSMPMRRREIGESENQ